MPDLQPGHRRALDRPITAALTAISCALSAAALTVAWHANRAITRHTNPQRHAPERNDLAARLAARKIAEGQHIIDINGRAHR